MSEAENEVEVNEKPVGRQGKLYVMFEEDYLTGETFDYYKIGIVRGARDMKDREKEHRTGNPRRILTKFELECKEVQKLETLLHNVYATNRVSSGEWFVFSPNSLIEMWNFAQQQKQILDDNSVILDLSEKFKSLIEREGVVDSNQDIIEAVKRLKLIADEIKYCKSLMKVTEDMLKTQFETDNSVEPYFKESQRAAQNNFSVQVLKKKSPELYSDFLTVTDTWQLKFLIQMTDEELDLDAKFKQAYGSEQEIKLLSNPIDVHQKHLSLWGRKSQLILEEEILEAQVISYCGEALQISEVFEWERKPKKAFDKNAFKALHPELYEQCFVQTEAKTTKAIAEWATYLVPRHLVK